MSIVVHLDDPPRFSYLRSSKYFVSFATSEIDVPLDSGVTSSFTSSSLLGWLLPRCTQASHPCLGHQDTWFPGINKFTSCWESIVDDDEDEAEGGPPSARPPPPPPRKHQPPGWSRVTTVSCLFGSYVLNDYAILVPLSRMHLAKSNV